MAGKKGRSGRKPKSMLRQKAEHCISETSPHAAAYLKMVAKGELGTFTRIITRKNGDVIEEPDQPIPADPVRVDVCKYIINQDCGMPRQKTEITGRDGKDLILAPKIMVTSDNGHKLACEICSGIGTEPLEIGEVSNN